MVGGRTVRVTVLATALVACGASERSGGSGGSERGGSETGGDSATGGSGQGGMVGGGGATAGGSSGSGVGGSAMAGASGLSGGAGRGGGAAGNAGGSGTPGSGGSGASAGGAAGAGSRLSDCAGLVCASDEQVVNVWNPALGTTQCACSPLPSDGRCVDCECGASLCAEYGATCLGFSLERGLLCTERG